MPEPKAGYMKVEFVLQPDGLYAGYADEVDRFVHLGMKRAYAVQIACQQQGYELAEAEAMLDATSPERFSELLEKSVAAYAGKKDRKNRPIDVLKPIPEHLRG